MSRRPEPCSTGTGDETQRRLNELLAEGQADRAAADEPGDMFDSAQPLIQQGTDDAVSEELHAHLDAIDRAERRLEAGTYGLFGAVRPADPRRSPGGGTHGGADG